MNARSSSGKGRGGMRFRPSRGLSSRKRGEAREAREARQVAVGRREPEEEPVFDQKRHAQAIQRSENLAAGLPPDASDAGIREAARQAGRPPAPAAPAPEEGGEFVPLPLPAPRPRSLGESLQRAAGRVIDVVRKIAAPSVHPHKELVVNSECLETRVAILVEGELRDFHVERTREERLVGSIYKGRVTNLESGLKAAFVDIGTGKNAFLHYWDIIPGRIDGSYEAVERQPRRRKAPKITRESIPEIYPPGSDIVVQVAKGPIGSKGARVTTSLALPGRYLVLLPTSEQSGVSKMIESREERERLKGIVRRLTLPEGMGVIVRTAGQGRRIRYFVRDLALLLDEWRRVQEAIESRPAPACVRQEPDLVDRTARDFLTEDVERVVVDTSAEYQRMRDRIGRFSRRSALKVRYYDQPQPVFDRFGVSRQIESVFSRRVDLKGGGYIVFDETEALVAIDVNTGSHKLPGKDQEATSFKVNLEAADEICRQLRLRNMGGIIVLDFIDMKAGKSQRAVLERMRRNLALDKARTHVLEISPLGLMEMTRQRTSESMNAEVYDDCPYCLGRGHIKGGHTMSVEIQRKIGELLKRQGQAPADQQIRVSASPDIVRRLQKEDNEVIVELEKRYFGRIFLEEDPSFHYEQFRIEDKKTGKALYQTDPSLLARRQNIARPRRRPRPASPGGGRRRRPAQGKAGA